MPKALCRLASKGCAFWLHQQHKRACLHRPLLHPSSCAHHFICRVGTHPCMVMHASGLHALVHAACVKGGACEPTPTCLMRAGTEHWHDLSCQGFVYTPQPEDAGCQLRLQCVPVEVQPQPSFGASVPPLAGDAGKCHEPQVCPPRNVLCQPSAWLDTTPCLLAPMCGCVRLCVRVLVHVYVFMHVCVCLCMCMSVGVCACVLVCLCGCIAQVARMV